MVQTILHFGFAIWISWRYSFLFGRYDEGLKIDEVLLELLVTTA
jgi:hypothetical protein